MTGIAWRELELPIAMTPESKLYGYVGPVEILQKAATFLGGHTVTKAADLEVWFSISQQKSDHDGMIAATFVISQFGELLVADRRSEHVACARGKPVRSAGEVFFGREGNGWRVVEITNQSTGYCPEPESWPAIAAALDRIPLAHPGRFTQELVFRRCPACDERTVVKDGWFVCGACGAELTRTWNFE